MSHPSKGGFPILSDLLKPWMYSTLIGMALIDGQNELYELDDVEFFSTHSLASRDLGWTF